MQISHKGSPVSFCQLMGLTELNTATCREVRRPRVKSPLLKFARASSQRAQNAKHRHPCFGSLWKGTLKPGPESQLWDHLLTDFLPALLPSSLPIISPGVDKALLVSW